MFDFGASPSAVFEDFKAKKPEVHFDYDEIMHETHARVFSVAKLMKIDLLKSMQESLATAAKEGMGFKDWKEGIIPELKKGGWFGEVRAVDTRSGEIKDIYVGSRRLKNIYGTNMRTTYARARYERQMESSLEYFRYVSVLDSATRPKHRQWHGLILPKDDPFWDKNYPPNDWGCRCSVNAYSREQIKAKGWKVSKAPSADIASSDFSYSPGRDTQKLRGLIDERLKELQKRGTSERILKALENELAFLERSVWERGLEEMIKAVVSGNIIKDKAFQVAQVGRLEPNIKKALKELDITPKAEGIVIYQNTISHITRDSKPAAKKPNIEEIKSVVGVFAQAKHVFYDHKEDVLLYFYGSMQDDGMVNYAVVRLDYVLKKFRMDNFVVTITKIPFKNLKPMLKQTDKNGKRTHTRIR